MERNEICCFTGHRPNRLPWGRDESAPHCLAVKERLEAAVQRAYDQGSRHFICGMAQGGDLYFAEAVLALRERCPDAALECARPCETQADRWPQEDRRRYQAILDQCNYETMVQHTYDRGCMMRRNRYMVDRSARIIALYDGVPKGGTANTLLYAIRKGLDVDIIDPIGETKP